MMDDKKVYEDRVRAGSRTFFFDVKINNKGDKYLVLTENKRKGDDWVKYRIQVYQEDIEKFRDALNKTVDQAF